MANLTLPLTQDHQRLVSIRRDGNGGEVRLQRAAGSHRSPMDRALANHLWVRLDDELLPYRSSNDGIAWDRSVARIQLLLGNESPFLLCEVLEGESSQRSYRLSPFESRFLAENGYPHPSPGLDVSMGVRLVTDLHSHFAGCVSAEDLIRIAEENDVSYPSEILARTGLDSSANGERSFRDLPHHTKSSLASKLRIPLDRQVPFVEMSAIYKRRSPLTKHDRLWRPLLSRIASDYQAMGVSYAELSLYNVLETGCLTAVHDVMPAIEEETGVKLRFLAALSRHDDLEWDLDCLDRLRAISASCYVVGVDFMGHETNSTHQFKAQLGEIARWAGAARPGFVIRVHAGENPAHPENIRVALESVAGNDVQLRIGHGLYGADNETLESLRASGAIVEFNLNSNFALNNVQCSQDVPLRRYVDAGVEVVLGTDGYGIYGTTIGYEAQAARLCGLKKQDLVRIRVTEDRYVARRLESDSRHTAGSFSPPEAVAPKFYTREVAERKQKKVVEEKRALLASLEALRVPLLDSTALEEITRNRQCVSIAGAWKRSWEQLSSQAKEQIGETIESLLGSWEPDTHTLLLGGTSNGVEGIVARAGIRRGFTVIGTLVEQTPPDSLASGHLTHATIISESLYDKAAALYQLIKANNGLCLFLGGGSIVSDEIQTAANLKLRYLLMDGIEGASAVHARQQPLRSFSNAAEALAKLSSFRSWRSSAEPYWHTGPNPTVDLVVVQTGSVLLVRRADDAQDEPGRWALPGGFQLTDAPRNSAWQPGRESATEACLRELQEETGLQLDHLEPRLEVIGIYEGWGRDPRDTPFAWSKTTAFMLTLEEGENEIDPRPGEDAAEARWWPLAELPSPLAFDHAMIIRDGVAKACTSS